MGTYREALQHARSGGIARLGGREIRFLTQEEANAVALVENPSRRLVRGDDGALKVEEGKLVVEEYGSANPRALGLYDVGVHPAVPFTPTADDMYLPVELDEEGQEKPRVPRTDWVRVDVDDKPEPVAPEAVDEALAETILDEHPLGEDFDEKIGPHKGE